MNLLHPLALLLGSIIGSFLNVLITRLPFGEDVVWKRSHCRDCHQLIRFYDNFPIVSWILLRGRCRHCGNKISIQYPLIELISAAIFLVFLPKDFNSASIVKYIFDVSVCSCLLVHFVIDFRHHILPNAINITLALVFSVYQFLYGDLISGLIGAAAGFIFPFTVTYIFLKVRGIVGLGGGDIKLYSALGLILGLKGIFINIFMSCFFGALIGGIYILLNKSDRNTQIPFGPYIIGVGVIQIYLPRQLEWISSLLF